MVSRKMILGVLSLPLLLSLTVMFAAAVPPQDTAGACLPCYCPQNPTLNCFGDYAIFTQVNGGVCHVDIYYVASTGGELLMSYDAADLAAVPAGAGGVLINTQRAISLYKNGPNNYQVSWGPNVENKMFVTDFSGCPARTVREYTYTVGGANESYQERLLSPGGPDYLDPSNANPNSTLPGQIQAPVDTVAQSVNSTAPVSSGTGISTVPFDPLAADPVPPPLRSGAGTSTIPFAAPPATVNPSMPQFFATNTPSPDLGILPAR